jgi:hypothetical protein
MRHVKYTKEVLSPLVADSLTLAEIIRKLGLRQSGGTQGNISRWIRIYGLDTSHFLGRRRNRGVRPKNRRQWEEILVLRSPEQRKEHAAVLRRALIESGVPYECCKCHCLPIWRGEPLILEIDHESGQWWDNRKNNLRFLCPNCHSQTETWGRKGPSVRTETLAAAIG